MPDLVSIIIPTYNRAYCVGNAIDSALAQTHAHLEAIVIDDGSTDSTREFMRQQYGREPRVKYLQQHNQGVAAARNTGIRSAQGDFIAFLDSDDLWMPWKLEMQLCCLRTLPHAGMIWSEMEAIDASGKVVQPRFLRTMYHAYRWFPADQLFQEKRPLASVMPNAPPQYQQDFLYAGDIFSPMVMGNLVHTSTALLRRERMEKVRGFDESLRFVGEDYELHLRTCREGPVAFLDVPTIQYQIAFEDRLTKMTYHAATSFLRTLQKTLTQDRDRIQLPRWMIRQALADSHQWIGNELLNRNEKSEARRYFWESLGHQPWQPRVFLQWLRCFLPGPMERALQWSVGRVKRAKSVMTR